jgi:hypothetical protein
VAERHFDLGLGKFFRMPFQLPTDEQYYRVRGAVKMRHNGELVFIENQTKQRVELGGGKNIHCGIT